MRKLMMAVMAVAGLGLVTGCQSKKEEVQEQRQDVAEAQRDAAKTTAEAQRDTQKDIAEAQHEGAEKQAEAQKDVGEEQGELAEAERDLAKDRGTLNDDATGGSGMTNVKTEEVKGTIQSTSGNNLTLLVPDKNNQLMRFQANSQVQVTRDDKPVALTDLKAGDEVRASYMTDAAGKMVLKTIDVKKESAQHPGKEKK
jgi:hypothetical protein